MKAFFLAVVMMAFGAPAFAVQVQMTCYPKSYQCYGGPAGVSCQWNNGPAQVAVMTLAQDLNYPNPNYPYQVWRGQYQSNFDNHVLVVNLSYSSDANAGLTMNASLVAPGVTADTSGHGTIDIGLHNQNYGRGFYCQANVLN